MGIWLVCTGFQGVSKACIQVIGNINFDQALLLQFGSEIWIFQLFGFSNFVVVSSSVLYMDQLVIKVLTSTLFYFEGGGARPRVAALDYRMITGGSSQS